MTAEQRTAEAACVLPAGTAVTGWAALRWCGGRWFDGTAEGGRTALPVDLVASCREVRAQSGMRVSQERLAPSDVVVHDGLPVTVAARSTCFLMGYAASITAAVVAAGMAAFSDLVSTAELGEYVMAHPGWTGIPRARRALDLMSENSWSPMETRLRMLWHSSGFLPPVLVNAPVFDRHGNHVATPDLLEPEAGLVVEYDGSDHLAGPQRQRDLSREDVIRDVGLDYVTVLGQHMAAPDRLIARLAHAHRRAAALPRTFSWTTTQPAWWIRADDVDSRRAVARLAEAG